MFPVQKIVNLVKKKIFRTYTEYNSLYQKFVSVSNMGHKGRMGNQLFQYAAARAYSLKYNLPILLPIDKHNRLVEFQPTCSFVEKKYLENVNKLTFNEKKFSYDSKFFDKNDKYDLNGLFQTEKYFYGIRKILLKELKPSKKNITDYCKDYINKLKNLYPNKDIVALHNRRGDNVPSKTEYSDLELGVFLNDKNRYHPLMNLDYFYRAIQMFDNCIFLVFSDTDKDVAWCKEKFKGDNFFFSEGHDDLTDLMLMKYCDHNIISNSSYGWWGAWLNENSKKKVIAPKVWFGEAYESWDTNDLIPSNWVVL